jgi:acyl-CoA synthetase (AMP-forming)/AMP-acid ligase II
MALFTLVNLLQNLASQHPVGAASPQGNRIAYTFLEDGEKPIASLTYRSLDEKARAIATYLQSQLSVGDRVLLVYPQGLESIVAFFGCLYAGVVAIPAPAPEAARLKRILPRLEAIAADAGASLILTTANDRIVCQKRDRTSRQRSHSLWDGAIARSLYPHVLWGG